MKIITRELFIFLETASMGELIARRDVYYEARRKIKDPDLKRDLARAIRLFDEELLARHDIACLERNRLKAQD